MIDATLLSQTCPEYTKEQQEAIARGFCPHCLPNHMMYRILSTFYSEKHGMTVNHVKCSDIVHCEWEEHIPHQRSEFGLDNFFHS